MIPPGSIVMAAALCALACGASTPPAQEAARPTESAPTKPASSQPPAHSAPELAYPRNACPTERPHLTESAPTFIVAGAAEVYDQMIADWQLTFPEHDDWPPLTAAQKESVVCTTMTNLELTAFYDLLDKRTPPARSLRDCFSATPRFPSLWKVSYEISKLETGKLLVTRNARLVETAQRRWVSVYRQGPYAISRAFTYGWYCPSTPEDECQLHLDPAVEGSATRPYCTDDATLLCQEAEFSTTIYVTHVATERTVEFGLMHRRPEPEVTIDEATVSVESADCQQTIPVARLRSDAR